MWAAGGLVALFVATTVRPSHVRLNLVVVTLDTTRADRIGAYRDARAAATPALDRLAREGVLFEDATSPAPLTLPAHCTIFTGRLPPTHGVHDNVERLDAAPPTLASVLRARNYKTGAFVGSVVLARSRGLSSGFDTYDDDIRWQGTSHRPRRRADAVVDRALRMIGEAKSTPFFVWLHFYDAHAPYEATAPFAQAHAGRLYEAAIASVDAQIGRLRAHLDRQDLTKRTVIVVIGDHGEGLGDHGELTHGLFVYQSVLRVPFIIRAPAIAPGRRVGIAVSSADLAPTVLELLGVPPIEGLDGRSLVPVLRRAVSDAAPDVYAENLYTRRFAWSEMRAIRSGSLKLIDKARPELYDVERDPGEIHDLSAERPAVVAALARRLASWQNRLAASAHPRRERGAPVTADARALLSLGYVSEGRMSAGAQDGPSDSDPRDHVATFNCYMAQVAAPPSPGLLLTEIASPNWGARSRCAEPVTRRVTARQRPH